MIPVQNGSHAELKVGLNKAKMANWRGFEPNERNPFGSISISYLVGGNFVNVNLAYPDYSGEDPKSVTDFSKAVAAHLSAVGVTTSQLNAFIMANFPGGEPSDKVDDPEKLAAALQSLITMPDMEGDLLVHLGSNNKHYAYTMGVGVIVTFENKSFEDLIALYNEHEGSLKDVKGVAAWGQRWVCPFFTNPVEIFRTKIGIVDYRTKEVNEDDWTVIKEVAGERVIYYYTNRFNWEQSVEEVTSDFEGDVEADEDPFGGVTEDELNAVFGDPTLD